ncbi:TIR domain-containing protein [Clostridium akagii]|uniref:TIR domain-containing protein n=1 Tax=Clostridium akagii TaxID=91623 RepID=UPI00047ED6E5|nr:nucleotide-binding protein [Clostridium akagii]
MFYHVLIETSEKIEKNKHNREIFELDIINRDNVLNDIIIPYLKKEQFQVNGYLLNYQDIVRVVAKVTEKSTKELASYENSHKQAGLLMYVSPKSILGYARYTKDITKEVFYEAKEIIDKDDSTSKVVDKMVKMDKTKVFIVHGHDELAKTEVARFIEKLGFTAIILHEQVNSGKTIIEKIEDYSNVGFAVVLYTSCDLGSAKGSDKMQPRARQNVVFEHGYLMGKLGRNRVCALVKDSVETPNDISGLVYILMDSYKAWASSLAKEMKAAGYEIDMNLITN